MIRTVTHSDFHFSENEETIDRRQAKEDIRAEGRVEGVFEILHGLVDDGLISIEEAAKRAGVSVEEFLRAAGR